MLLYQKTFPLSSSRTQPSAFLSRNTVVWRKQFEFLMRLYGLLEYPEEPGNDDSILWVDGNGINIDDKVKLLGILKQSSPMTKFNSFSGNLWLGFLSCQQRCRKGSLQSYVVR
jgi:hypothetical protein